MDFIPNHAQAQRESVVYAPPSSSPPTRCTSTLLSSSGLLIHRGDGGPYSATIGEPDKFQNLKSWSDYVGSMS